MVSRQTWVRVGNWVALIGLPNKRRLGRPYLPTWFVLGPLREGEPTRPTVASGCTELVEGGTDVRIVLTEGILPPQLEPALAEAARNLVRSRPA